MDVRTNSITTWNPKFKVAGNYSLNTKHNAHTLEELHTEKEKTYVT